MLLRWNRSDVVPPDPAPWGPTLRFHSHSWRAPPLPSLTACLFFLSSHYHSAFFWKASLTNYDSWLKKLSPFTPFWRTVYGHEMTNFILLWLQLSFICLFVSSGDGSSMAYFTKKKFVCQSPSHHLMAFMWWVLCGAACWSVLYFVLFVSIFPLKEFDHLVFFPEFI